MKDLGFLLFVLFMAILIIAFNFENFFMFILKK